LVWTQPGKPSIVKYNSHAAIVDADNWHYAFNHLSDVDLEGMPIEREEKTVRYTQKSSVDSGALFAGTRDNGKLVVDGVQGAHVYYNDAIKCYILRNRIVPTVYGFETSVTTKELDAVFEARLLHWLQISDRAGEDWITIDERMERIFTTNEQGEQTERDWLVSRAITGEQTPSSAMDNVEQSTGVQPTSSIADFLEETNQELASVQRALKFQDSMSDERLEATLKKEARLIKRRAELKQAIEQEEVLAKKRAQARDDIDTAASKWAKWTIDERRSFIHLVTESIVLEEIASGWLRLTIGWSLLMGFISPTTSTMQAVDVAYIWRQSGTRWSDDEEDTIRKLYPNATRAEILHALPNRSWASIGARAKRLSPAVRRYNLNKEHWSIPDDMSLSDAQVISEFMLEPEKRVQWYHLHLSNGDFLS
jgi:hypothetical protein